MENSNSVSIESFDMMIDDQILYHTLLRPSPLFEESCKQDLSVLEALYGKK
jgi:hypothetical protein